MHIQKQQQKANLSGECIIFQDNKCNIIMGKTCFKLQFAAKF